MRKTDVLLVDDDRDYAKAVGRLLTRQNHDVRIAGSIDEAKALIVQKVPDVVLCDFRMEPQNGDHLLRALAITHPSVRRLLVSASPRSELQPFFDLGLAHAIVEKAEPIESLFAQLRSAPQKAETT